MVAQNPDGGYLITPTDPLMEALFRDLEHSAMFLGHHEGLILGDLMRVQAEIYGIGLPAAPGELPRIVTWDRAGNHEIVAPTAPDAPLILAVSGHYTVIRPAREGQKAQYALSSGEPYAEVTLEDRTSGTPVTRPLIPSDGNCLLASLHYVKTNAPMSEEEKRGYRRFLAEHLRREAGRDVVTDLLSDMVLSLLNVHDVKPYVDEREAYSTLGPAVSAILKQDHSFGAAYQAVLAEAVVDQKQIQDYFQW
jgi:hypothetical protein